VVTNTVSIVNSNSASNTKSNTLNALLGGQVLYIPKSWPINGRSAAAKNPAYSGVSCHPVNYSEISYLKGGRDN